MNIFEPVIRRPGATSLLAIGLIIAGFCAYLVLGLAAFPSMQFPAVTVQALLPGADAQTVAATVTAPLERQFGRIPGIQQMTSDANPGGTQIQILFDTSRSADDAARDVEAAINAAIPDLPAVMALSPPQLFKADTTQIPVLLDTEWYGKQRKLLVLANRNGFVYVLDRTNGEFLSAKPFGRVTWAKGIGADGKPIVNTALETKDGGNLVCPGALGMTNW